MTNYCIRSSDGGALLRVFACVLRVCSVQYVDGFCLRFLASLFLFLLLRFNMDACLINK